MMFLRITIVLLTTIIILSSARSIRKRQSGPHNQLHRRRRTLEEMYNRLQLINSLVNRPTSQGNRRFVAVRLEFNEFERTDVRTIVQRMNISTAGPERSPMPTRVFSTGAEGEFIRGRNRSGANIRSKKYRVSYVVPISDGLQVRIETEQSLSLASTPRATAHRRLPENLLRQKISELCATINTRVASGVRLSCFGS